MKKSNVFWIIPLLFCFSVFICISCVSKEKRTELGMNILKDPDVFDDTDSTRLAAFAERAIGIVKEDQTIDYLSAELYGKYPRFTHIKALYGKPDKKRNISVFDSFSKSNRQIECRFYGWIGFCGDGETVERIVISR